MLQCSLYRMLTNAVWLILFTPHYHNLHAMKTCNKLLKFCAVRVIHWSIDPSIHSPCPLIQELICVRERLIRSYEIIHHLFPLSLFLLLFISMQWSFVSWCHHRWNKYRRCKVFLRLMLLACLCKGSIWHFLNLGQLNMWWILEWSLQTQCKTNSAHLILKHCVIHCFAWLKVFLVIGGPCLNLKRFWKCEGLVLVMKTWIKHEISDERKTRMKFWAWFPPPHYGEGLAHDIVLFCSQYWRWRKNHPRRKENLQILTVHTFLG